MTQKWHPVKRREKSLNSMFAEAMGEDLHLFQDSEMGGFELSLRLDLHMGGYEVSADELDLMRRVAFS